MKNFKYVLTIILSLIFSVGSFAQSVTEVFTVSGNCGMCKSRIEAAAKEAGASQANWDADSKKIKVNFDASATSVVKIQEKIAAVGHDNPGFKASDEVYNKLHGCCKYDRTSAEQAVAMSCCKDGKCKDGSCKNTKKECCQNGTCDKKDKKGKSCCDNCAKS
jgi:mercuric ion binding protein